MHFTPIIALAGLAAAAPSGLVYRNTNETVPAYKFSRSTQIVNDTVPAYKGVKLVSRSAHNFNTTGLSVTPSS